MICGYKMLGIYRKYEKLYINDRLYSSYDDLIIENEYKAIDSTITFSTWEELIEKYINNHTHIVTNCIHSNQKATSIYGHLWHFNKKKFKNAKVDIAYSKIDDISINEIFENFSHEKAIKYLRQFIEPQNDSAKIIKIKEIKKDELSDFINKTVIDEKPKEKKKFIFQLSDEQQVKYRKWARTHDCIIRNKDGIRYVGAAGGADTFHITGTGLGWIVKVKCSCGSKLDLTEEF